MRFYLFFFKDWLVKAVACSSSFAEEERGGTLLPEFIHPRFKKDYFLPIAIA